MLSQLLMWLRTEEEGQTLVEYALIIALIAIVLILALTALAGGIDEIFNYIADTLTGAGGS